MPKQKTRENDLHELRGNDCGYNEGTTVYVQIFEGCKFCGQPKSRISAILFLWIFCYHTLCFKCIMTVL